jgi:hypothetical protein
MNLYKPLEPLLGALLLPGAFVLVLEGCLLVPFLLEQTCTQVVIGPMEAFESRLLA